MMKRSLYRGGRYSLAFITAFRTPLSHPRAVFRGIHPLAAIDLTSVTKIKSNKVVHRQVSLHYSPLQVTIMRKRISESDVLVTILWRPEGPPERRRKNLTVTTFWSTTCWRARTVLGALDMAQGSPATTMATPDPATWRIKSTPCRTLWSLTVM